MANIVRRVNAALRRAAGFYRGRVRFSLALAAGLAIAGLVLSSGAARLILVGAFLLVFALIVFSGSRAHREQQHRNAPSSESIVHTAWGIAGADGPLVTVVVTSHDDAWFVRDCLESVRSQTWASWECIVVDDASTDHTLEVAFDAARGDVRFEIIALQSTRGVSFTRNLGIDKASGEFITFLDADDYLFVRSLETRALALSERRSRPGVAGVFCDWVGVAELAERTEEGRGPLSRDRITWFDGADGAPVINSAPLLLTSEIRRIGGYRDSWAEDADLWNRLLRHGYVLDPVAHTGVAYRQKAASRFRVSARNHNQAMISIAESNRQALDSAERVTGTPHVYDQDIDSYRLTLGRLKRHLMGLATAHGADDRAGVEELVARVAEEWEPYAWMAIDVEQTVWHAAMRHEAFEDAGRADRAERTTKAITAALDERLAVPSWIPTVLDSRSLEPEAGGRRLRSHVRRAAAGADLVEIVRDSVVLMPAVGYHVDEMGPLAEELARRGRSVVFAISDRRWPDVEAALRLFEAPIVACPDPGSWVEAAAAYVTLNDWGELYRDIVVEAKIRGVPTFAKVEGVQDWGDVDVHWNRDAYQTVDHVLCQGRNDERALAERSTHIVGSTRLEHIWRQPARPAQRDLAVLNSNFTYEVMSEARDAWLDAACAACEASGIAYTISMHPSERPIHRAHIADEPMKHLLTKASVLVSRFSTVPFEAMARGVPFVYFNPHGERVPTFGDPRGAFDIATDQSELATALDASRSWKDNYRERSVGYFLEQVDVDPSRSSAERSADVIESICFK